MRTLLLAVCALTIGFTTPAQTPFSVKHGSWIGQLKLNSYNHLPFNISISGSKDTASFTIHNGDEAIVLTPESVAGDSIKVYFSTFNTALFFKATGKKKLNGYWINYNKANYTIPFEANFSKGNRFEERKTSKTIDFSGKWQTTFSPQTPDEYPALGIFEQRGNSINGTFLTETGDYRFLDGNAYGNHFALSCFDGSHAFLFTATMGDNGELTGTFYSGTHWQTTWVAERNEYYELTHPDSLTYLTDSKEHFSFSLPQTDSTLFNYPHKDYENKVVIIQLMGTWCPNCMDESVYFKELYNTYHQRGLEIISIGYEAGNSFSQHAERITQYRDRLGLNHLFLVGGSANKNRAAEQFPMLNDITSFPTTIFIGRDGEIKRIHTGFNGPGTGVYYLEYVKNTNELIESLLKD